MATPLRKTHFLITLIATWINAATRGLGALAPAFVGAVPTAAEVDALTGTGFATAGQVVTTSDNQTVTLNQYAGCWLITATHAPCLIVSHPAAAAASVAFTVYGAAPATTAEGYRVLRAPTPSGSASALQGSRVHYDVAEYAVVAANASNLATSRALLRALLVALVTHGEDTLAHTIADASLPGSGDLASGLAELAGAPLTGTGSLTAFANQLKSVLNGHFTAVGVHPTNDVARSITSPDATDQSSLNTLLNEIKADLNAHMADGLAIPSWRVLQD